MAATEENLLPVGVFTIVDMRNPEQFATDLVFDTPEEALTWYRKNFPRDDEGTRDIRILKVEQSVTIRFTLHETVEFLASVPTPPGQIGA